MDGHLVIVGGPRVGAHMLRSMLKADPRVRDIGAFLQPFEGLIPMPDKADAATVAAVYQRELAATPDRLLLSNLKTTLGLDPVTAAMDTGGRFIHLTRRDTLAQVASLALAAKHQAFFRQAPEGSTVTLQAEAVSRWTRAFRLGETATRARIVTAPHVELAYEDLTVEAVSAAVRSLGYDLDVGEPTTEKLAPPLGAYVTNLSELR